MKSAKNMFEDLGFEKFNFPGHEEIDEYDKSITYIYHHPMGWDERITFYIKRKYIEFESSRNEEITQIHNDLLKAINKQVEELNW